MEISTKTQKPTIAKLPDFFRRVFKPAVVPTAQSLVDNELRRMAKRHQAASLFAPTFNKWNR